MAGSVSVSNCSGPSNNILLHINLLDPDNVREQEAIGILGVNLIYSAFYELQTRESFLESVAQDIVKRIEIDYIDLCGPAFESWDCRTLPAYLVFAGLAEAVFFPSKGPVAPPTEALHNKAVVLAPGYFGHVDANHAQVQLASGIQQFRNELGETHALPSGFFCLTASSFAPTEPPPQVPELMHRIDNLVASGGDVLLFRQHELYHMTSFVNRYTKAPVRLVLGLSLVIRAFEDLYGNLEGSRLEALGRLFAQNVRIYAHPMTARDLREWLNSFSATGWEWNETNGWVTAAQLRGAPPIGHLYDYLLASNFLVPMPVPATRDSGA